MSDREPVNIMGVIAFPNPDHDKRMIRFIDSEYHTLFTIKDGESIVITRFDGEKMVFPCKYIDDCHVCIGNSAYHICEFAEMQERSGNTYVPRTPKISAEIGTYEIYQIPATADVDYYFRPYEGVLSLDHTTIQVEAAGYGTSSRTVTAERTYPNLSDADVSLVPKSVNENGRTLTLADVSWQEAAVDPTDGYDIPIRYTAVASYTGTATSKYATGYTVTADYKGDVTRASCDTVVYTAVFSSVGNEAATDSSSFNWLWLLIPVGAAALGGCGYAGYKGYRHYINKKRGYAA